LNKEVSRLEQKLKEEREWTQAANEEAEDYKAQVKELESDKEKVEKELTDVREERKKLENEIGQLREKIKETENKVNELTLDSKEKDILFTRVKELEKELTSATKERDNVASKLKDTESLLKVAQEEQETVHQEENRLRDEVSALTNELLEKGEALHEAQERCKMIEAQYDEMEAGVKHLSENKRTEELAIESNNRKMKALEKEMRDMYTTLEEKNTQFFQANEKIKELEKALEEAESKEDKDESINESIYQEEIDELQKELKEMTEENKKLQIELDKKTKETNNIEAALEMRSVANQMKAAPPPSPNPIQFNSENATFAEPTEAEYLRNVLYRYMVERETLGKEIVTLAKVICQVLKFSPTEQSAVLQKEESRTHHGWYGDTVGSVLKL
jgi:chromosome segregation ATPase